MKVVYYIHILASAWCGLCAYMWSTALVLDDNAIGNGTFHVMVAMFMLLRAISIGNTIEATKRQGA